MSLRQLAESDLAYTLEDTVTGFGWPITLTDPSGFSGNEALSGSSNDISQVVDSETGQIVSGRSASVVLRISSIYTAGFLSLPQGVANAGIKPWLVSFDSINNSNYTFKVVKSNPDRKIGLVSCLLEFYQ